MTPDVYRGGGGFLGRALEIGTGGLVKSGATKDKIKAAEQAQAEQAGILAKQKQDILEEEQMRKERIGRSRQGRRALLFSGGTESGVAKATTLGG